MENCPSSIVLNLIEDPCQGNQISTNCVIYGDNIVYLGVPPNSTITVVVQSLLTSLIDARNRLSLLETQNLNLESRITALENA